MYGEDFVTYNVHALLHISEDCQHYSKSLNELSAFPVENEIHQLKRKIVGSMNKLVELCKKLQEIGSRRSSTNFRISKVSVKLPNNCFILSNEQIAILKSKQGEGCYLPA